MLILPFINICYIIITTTITITQHQLNTTILELIKVCVCTVHGVFLSRQQFDQCPESIFLIHIDE